MTMDLYKKIKNAVYNFYVKSPDYNGIPLRQISTDFHIGYEDSIDIIKQLVQDDFVMIQSSTNPHIYNFENDIESQLNVLESAKTITEKIERFGSIKIHFENTNCPICLYPTKNYLIKKRDVSNMPIYSKKLALCEPQLKVFYFDINVLERYNLDPRYELYFSNYYGRISYVGDENGNSDLGENDQIYLKTFGLGYNSKGERVIGVFLRYLGRLSDAHQAYWYSYEIDHAKCKMVKEYYENTIEGKWTGAYSIYHAFTCELNTLNELSLSAFGLPLFNTVFDEDSLTFSFLPTSKNYYDFVLKLDKMISDNLNRDFFKSFGMELFTYTEKDGIVEKTNKGTIQLFEEWLLKHYHTRDSDEIKNIFKSFRKIRKERQTPAHKTIDNVFSNEYAQKQDVLMREAYLSMSSLRKIFQQHPKAKNVKSHNCLDESEIKMF